VWGKVIVETESIQRMSVIVICWYLVVLSATNSNQSNENLTVGTESIQRMSVIVICRHFVVLSVTNNGMLIVGTESKERVCVLVIYH
jgi:hypothetical protein